MKHSQIYLTRRNLLALLSKLDRKRNGDESACTIIKNDNVHPKYPQSMKSIHVTAVEDEDYYIDRAAGDIHPLDIVTQNGDQNAGAAQTST